MAIRIALFAVPAVAVAGLVLFLNVVNAGTGIAAAALGALAVATGATFGYFADRLPELPGARRSHRPAGLYHGD
jgi:energy-converting hydrogenase Eha subunit A